MAGSWRHTQNTTKTVIFTPKKLFDLKTNQSAPVRTLLEQNRTEELYQNPTEQNFCSLSKTVPFLGS